MVDLLLSVHAPSLRRSCRAAPRHPRHADFKTLLFGPSHGHGIVIYIKQTTATHSGSTMVCSTPRCTASNRRLYLVEMGEAAGKT